MSSSATTTAPLIIDGVTTPANDIRLALDTLASSHGVAGALATRSGVTLAGTTPLKVTAGTGMTVHVGAGRARVLGTDNSTQGSYGAALTAQATLDIATSDATNPRKDLVVLAVVDNGDATSTYVVEVVTGTPATPALDPAVPNNAVSLGRVNVGAGVSSITSGNIDDLRPWTVAAGGILPVASSSFYPTAGPAGTYFHDLATGALIYWDGAAVQRTRGAQLILSRTTPPNLTSGNTPQYQQFDGSAVFSQDWSAYPGTPNAFPLPYTGTWSSVFHAGFAANGTGQRRVHINTAAEVITDSRPSVGGGDVTHAHCSHTWRGNAGDIVKFGLDQNSGSSLGLVFVRASLVQLR